MIETFGGRKIRHEVDGDSEPKVWRHVDGENGVKRRVAFGILEQALRAGLHVFQYVRPHITKVVLGYQALEKHIRADMSHLVIRFLENFGYKGFGNCEAVTAVGNGVGFVKKKVTALWSERMSRKFLATIGIKEKISQLLDLHSQRRISFVTFEKTLVELLGKVEFDCGETELGRSFPVS